MITPLRRNTHYIFQYCGSVQGVGYAVVVHVTGKVAVFAYHDDILTSSICAGDHSRAVLIDLYAALPSFVQSDSTRACAVTGFTCPGTSLADVVYLGFNEPDISSHTLLVANGSGVNIAPVYAVKLNSTSESSATIVAVI